MPYYGWLLYSTMFVHNLKLVKNHEVTKQYFLFIIDMFFGLNFLHHFDVCTFMIAKIIIVNTREYVLRPFSHFQHVQNMLWSIWLSNFETLHYKLSIQNVLKGLFIFCVWIRLARTEIDGKIKNLEKDGFIGKYIIGIISLENSFNLECWEYVFIFNSVSAWQTLEMKLGLENLQKMFHCWA